MQCVDKALSEYVRTLQVGAQHKAWQCKAKGRLLF
jgi:hypothetical protein